MDSPCFSLFYGSKCGRSHLETRRIGRTFLRIPGGHHEGAAGVRHRKAFALDAVHTALDSRQEEAYEVVLPLFAPFSAVFRRFGAVLSCFQAVSRCHEACSRFTSSM